MHKSSSMATLSTPTLLTGILENVCMCFRWRRWKLRLVDGGDGSFGGGGDGRGVVGGNSWLLIDLINCWL